MSDTHDHRGRGLEATGAAGIGATVSHNRIGRAAAAANTSVQTRRLADIQARKAAARRATTSPAPHSTWAKAGADQGVSGGAARRAALGERSRQLRHLQGREDNVRRAIRGSGVLRARVASTALRGGMAVGPAALYLGARRRAEPVVKYTTRDVNAAAGGAAVGVGAHQAVGWYGGHALEAKAKRKVDADPALRRRLDEHRAASGITGKTPTGDKKWLGFFRKYPHDLPGATTKRALSYTHAGKTGVAANLAVATGAGAAAVAARRHHEQKEAAVAKNDPFGVAKRDSNDARMQTRVIRSGPYTKRNRRQLAHHAAVGGAVGGSAGTAVGAHLGAHIHGTMAREVARGGVPPEVGRGKAALLIGGALGAAGAGYGAMTGAAVAAEQRKKQRAKAQARHELKQQVSKADPLAITGAAYRAPGRLAEFKRAYSGTRKGEHIVERAHLTPKTTPRKDRWGYTRGHDIIGDHGADARKHLNVAISRAHEGSNHRASFRAGVRTGRAAATAGRHPEYAVSVPAAGAGVGVVHHEVTNKKKPKKKGAPVAKSAFFAKARDDSPKKAAAKGAVGGAALSYGIDNAATHGQLHGALRGLEREVGDKITNKGEIHLRAVPGIARGLAKRPSTLAWAGGTAAAGGLAAAHRAKKRQGAITGEAVAKSAFGVVDERLEKGFLTSGMEALKGVKSGLSGAVGAEKTGAAAAGKTAGAVTRGKVMPIARGATKTPARAAATAGGAGLGTGLLLSNKNN